MSPRWTRSAAACACFLLGQVPEPALAQDAARPAPSKHEFLPLPPGAVARCAGPALGHVGPAAAVAVGPKWIVSAGQEGFIHFWDRRTFEHRSVLALPEPGGLDLVRLSGDGGRLASVTRSRVFLGSQQLSLCVLEPFTRPWNPPQCTSYPDFDVASLALDATGKRGWWTDANNVGLLDASAAVTTDWWSDEDAVPEFARLVAPGRERLALLSGAGIRVKEPSKYDEGALLDVPGATFTALWMSHDAKLVAAATTAGELHLWDLKALGMQGRPPRYERAKAGVALGDGRFSVLGSTDNGTTLYAASRTKIVLVDGPTRAVRARVGTAGEIASCALAADRRTLVAGLADGAVLAWDAKPDLSEVTGPRRLDTPPVALVSVAPCATAGGGVLACASADGSLRTWKADGTLVETISPDGAWRALALARDGSFLLRGDGTSVRLERRPSGEVAWTVPVVAQAPAAVSDDGLHVAVTEDGRRLAVLDAADGRVVARTPGTGTWWGSPGVFPASGPLPLSAVAPDGAVTELVADLARYRRAGASRDAKLAFIEDRDGLAVQRDGSVAETLPRPDRPWVGATTAMAVSDDRRFAAMASDAGCLAVYDLAARKPIAVLRDPALAPVVSVLFLAEGRVVTADAYGTAIVWDPKRAPK